MSVSSPNASTQGEFPAGIPAGEMEEPRLASHTKYGLRRTEEQFAYYEQQMTGLEAARVLLGNDPEFHELLTPDVNKTIDTSIEHTAQKLNTADERYRATHDKLTGLLNRAGLESEMENIKDSDPRIFLFADATNFKSVNDRFGHTVGDGMLREISGVLRSSLRLQGDDILARLGGDEFVAVLKTTPQGNNRRVGDELPEVQVKAVGERIANTMDEMLDTYPHIRDAGLQLAVGTVLMQPGQHIDDLKSAAEATMREHKAGQHKKLGKHRP